MFNFTSHNWSISDLKNYIDKNPTKLTKEITELIKSAPQKNKYHNNKPEYNGCIFDSNWELDRYLQLVMLEKAGEIRELRRQVSFKLLNECIREVNGKRKKQRSLVYFADFVYFDNLGNHVVEDAKNAYNAKKDRAYINKRKMFISKYGQFYKFIESFSNGTFKEY